MAQKSAEWTGTFLDALREMPIVTHACDRAGIARSTAYKYRQRSPAFAEAWDHAIEEGLDHLEAVAWTQAREKGTVSLLTFLLRSRRYNTRAGSASQPAPASGDFAVALHPADDDSSEDDEANDPDT